MDIPLLTPIQPDIYSYGFDKTLNRNTPSVSSPIVYDTTDSTAGQNVSYGNILIGSKNTNITADPKTGLWVGNASFASAPFSVDMQGNLIANSATIATDWQQLGETILSSAGSSLASPTLAARLDLTVVCRILGVSTTTGNLFIRFNGDAAGNYAWRRTVNGAADTTGGSATEVRAGDGDVSTGYEVNLFFSITNRSASEKGVQGGLVMGATGAANVPVRVTFTGKWINTVSQITSINVLDTSANNFASGSRITVYGKKN